MFGMTSGDTFFSILIIAVAIYAGWSRYCECRWPEDRYKQSPQGSEEANG